MVAVAMGLLMAAAICLTVFVFLPAIARARFVREMSELRDEVDDAILAGQLPASPSVCSYIEKADELLEDPRGVSLAFVLALHAAFDKHGVPMPHEELSYADLTPEQRRMMHDFDQRAVQSLANHLVHGSALAVPWRCVRMIRSVRSRVRSVVPAPPPMQLADEYHRLPDAQHFQVA